MYTNPKCGRSNSGWEGSRSPSADHQPHSGRGWVAWGMETKKREIRLKEGAGARMSITDGSAGSNMGAGDD